MAALDPIDGYDTWKMRSPPEYSGEDIEPEDEECRIFVVRQQQPRETATDLLNGFSRVVPVERWVCEQHLMGVKGRCVRVLPRESVDACELCPE